jgi:hypothetical protein
VNLEEDHKGQKMEPEKLARVIEKSFLTAAGRKLARIVLNSATESTENTERK